MWPYRSFLFVPGNRADLAAKVDRWGPDAVVLDLEDSVAAGEKVAARTAVAGVLGTFAESRFATFVRINPVSEGGGEDLAAVVRVGLAGIILPKADSVADVADLADRLSYLEGRTGLPHGHVAIVPVPETAKGMADARAIAGASPRVKGLVSAVTGTGRDPDSIFAGDMASAIGFRPSADGREQDYICSKIVLDSRAAGAAFPVAGVLGTSIEDVEQVQALCERAKSFGFRGVMLIHPSHVAIANATFTPSAGQVAFARGVIAAMAEAGGGAVRYRGIMVDQAVLAAARQTIAEASRWSVADHVA